MTIPNAIGHCNILSYKLSFFSYSTECEINTRVDKMLGRNRKDMQKGGDSKGARVSISQKGIEIKHEGKPVSGVTLTWGRTQG